MELVLKTSGQKCLVGSNPTPSATRLSIQRNEPENKGGYLKMPDLLGIVGFP